MKALRFPAIVLASLIATSASAGVNRWTSIGPWGGPIKCLESRPGDPNAVYAGGIDGLYRSRDAGRTWVRIAATSTQVLAVAVSDAAPDTIYFSSGALHRSDDSGSTWTTLSVPTQFQDGVTAIVIDATGDVYVGTYMHGIFRSGDLGQTWLGVSVGIEDLTHNGVTCLAAHPTAPGVIYAGVFHGSGSGGAIYRTTDHGAHWTLATTGYWPKSIRVAANGEVYAAIFGSGIVWSADGVSWMALEGGISIPSTMYSIAIEPSAATEVWAGAFSRVFRWLPESGWSEIEGSFGSSRIEALLFQPESAETIVAGTSRGVFRGSAGGLSPSSSGLSPWPVAAIAIDPNGAILAGRYSFELDVAATEVFRSDDHGRTWRSSLLPQPNPWNMPVPQILAVMKLSEQAVAVYAGAVCVDARRCMTGTEHLWRSFDGGTTWQLGGPDGNVRALAIDPVGRRVGYLAVENCTSTPTPACELVVYRTEDGGVSWTPADSTLAFPKAVDPADPRIVYAQGASSLLRSTDGARSWSDTGVERIRAVAIASPSAVYAAESGFFRSRDSGTTWERVGDAPGGGVLSLLADSSDPNVVYAAVYEGGVLRSLDGGETWERFGSGLSSRLVNQLVRDFEGRFYAATWDGLFLLETRSPHLIAPRS